MTKNCPDCKKPMFYCSNEDGTEKGWYCDDCVYWIEIPTEQKK